MYASGSPQQHLPSRQHVGLAAEAADALDAADEPGAYSRLHARELGRRRPVGQERRHLFVERLLDGGEVTAWLGSGPDNELTADLAVVEVRRRRRWRVDRCRPAACRAATSCRRPSTPASIPMCVASAVPNGGHVPDLVDARLRHAVLHLLPVHAVHLRRPTLEPARPAGRRECRRNISRPSRAPSSGSMSPATTTTALAAP